MKVKFKLFILSLMGVVLLTSGFSCKLFPGKNAPTEVTQVINLTYWGVWDDSDYLEPIITDFEALHPNVKITYRKFRYAEYEQQLLEAWAEDRGPDIYSLPAAWLKQYENRITPEPETIRLAFREINKTLGKTEINTVVRSVPVLKAADIKNQFADVVYDDVVRDNKIYGIPYSLDTLIMYYNRDLLDRGGVATPPSTWTDVKEATKVLTQINQKNQITQSSVVMGTAENNANATDIVSLLMMQNGTQMAEQNGKVTFNLSAAGEKNYFPGLEALRFYTDFADPIKEVYTWNSAQPDALEAFISGKVAMYFGYSYDLPVIKGRSPKLNLGLSAIPQIQGASQPINYTNYWVETVSHKTKNAETAWGFLNFASSSGEVAKYLAKAQKPTALRSLILEQKNDPILGVFANQILSAKRWYKGNDELKMKEIFSQLIDGFSTVADPYKLLDSAVAQINQTL